jgi:hypothetical protein
LRIFGSYWCCSCSSAPLHQSYCDELDISETTVTTWRLGRSRPLVEARPLLMVTWRRPNALTELEQRTVLDGRRWQGRRFRWRLYGWRP